MISVQTAISCFLASGAAQFELFFKEDARAELKKLFPEISPIPAKTELTDERFVEDLEESQAEILITCWDTPICVKDWLESGQQQIKYVCNVTGELSRFVPRGFIEAGGLVTNWGNAISPIIAESAIYLTLSALRRSKNVSLRMSQERSWNVDQLEHQSLVGKKVGIHGFGAIAQTLVGMLRAFHVDVSSFSEPVPDAVFASHGVRKADSLEALFAENEIVIELEALNENTRGIVDRRLFDLIPDGGVFVNLGRGAVVDEDDLVAAARSRPLQLALDVFRSEPLPPDSPLRDLENVFVSPHAAGPHRDSAWRCGDFALANLRRYTLGEPLQAIVDVDRYDRIT